MPKKTFESIIKQLSKINYRHKISFSGYCEPVFDKRLPEFVRYARLLLPNAFISIGSNGDFLTKEKYNELVDAGIDYIVVCRHDGKTMPFQADKMLVKFNIDNTSLYNRGGLVEVKNSMFNAKMCILPVTRLFIRTSGSMSLCCNDFFDENSLGNKKNESLFKIWKKSSKFRHNVANGKLISKIKVCRKCTGLEKGGMGVSIPKKS